MIDQRAWTQWLQQHGPAMLLLARQHVPRLADAQDVVQDAFVRFWAARERVMDAKAYLFACVRSSALDHRRTGARRDRRESSAARPETGEGALFAAAGLEHAERQAAIEAAVARLPESQREVLVLKIWAKLTFVQIGQALDIPQDTAASRYRYALARLREQLTEELIP